MNPSIHPSIHQSIRYSANHPRPPLVLLHGWGMNSGVWSPLLPLLEEGYRPIPLALPGHGERPFAPSQQTLSAWAEECLEQAPEEAIWLGWSLGGLVAMQAALQAPQRVSALICVASSPRFTRHQDWPWAMDPLVLEGFAAAFAQDHQTSLERFLALQVRGDPDARGLLRRLKATLKQHPTPNSAALKVGLELLRHADLRPSIGQLVPPSCWLFGERDTLIPAQLAPQLASLVPHSRQEIIPQAAHAPFLSHPQAFMTILNAFLEVA